jgi:protoheme ferro-lyase
MIRIAWLDWQQPDVTESVRHVAALGATRVIIAPSTIALPTIATNLDVRQAIDVSRLPEGVHAMVLPAWGDDAVFVRAVVESAAHALAAAEGSARP